MTELDADYAECSLSTEARQMTPTQQSVYLMATLLCLRDDQAWVAVSYLAHCLNMTEEGVRYVVGELHDLGVAWITGPSFSDMNYVGTNAAENFSMLAIGPGGRPSQKQWEQLRRFAYQRSEGRPVCSYCDTRSGPFALDHAVPVSRGGSNHPNNLLWACVPCNSAKRDKTFSEFMEARRGRCET